MLSRLRFKLCGKVTVGVIFNLFKFSIITKKLRVLGAEVRHPSWKMFSLPQDIKINTVLTSIVGREGSHLASI